MLIEMLIYLLKYKQASVKAKNLGIPFGYWMVYTHCFVELSVESLMNVKRKIGKWLGLWLCVFISYFSFRLQFRSYEIVSFFSCVYALAYVIRLHLNSCIHGYNSFISLQRPSNAVQVCRLHSCQRTAHMHHNRLKILHSFAVHYAAHNS